MKQHWPIIVVSVILSILMILGIFALAILILKLFGSAGLFVYTISLIAFSIFVIRIKV